MSFRRRLTKLIVSIISTSLRKFKRVSTPGKRRSLKWITTLSEGTTDKEEYAGLITSILSSKTEFCGPGVPPFSELLARQFSSSRQKSLGSTFSIDQPPSFLS